MSELIAEAVRIARALWAGGDCGALERVSEEALVDDTV